MITPWSAIIYVGNVRFPTEKAYGAAIMHACEAL